MSVGIHRTGWSHHEGGSPPQPARFFRNGHTAIIPTAAGQFFRRMRPR